MQKTLWDYFINLQVKVKQGDADLKFFTDNLVNPYIEGVERLDQMNTAITLEYKKLTKSSP